MRGSKYLMICQAASRANHSTVVPSDQYLTVCGVECLLCRPTRVPAFARSLTSSLAAKFLFALQDSHVSLKLCESQGVCRVAWLQTVKLNV